MAKYALVTGASKGIGKSLATVLAKSGYHLLLVSRSEKDLQDLSKSLKNQYAVQAHFLSCDLSVSGASNQVATWCQSITSELEVVVNNAGYGLFGNFDTLSLEGQSEMIRLNINAVVELSHLLLPKLKTQKQAYILNVASTAAYQAMPTLAIYAATKAFILSYSRALRYELKDSTVSVTCLSPGPTDTGFASRAGLDMLAELAEKFNMQPDKVARIGLKAMYRKKPEVIPGLVNKFSAFGAGLIPKSLVERITKFTLGTTITAEQQAFFNKNGFIHFKNFIKAQSSVIGEESRRRVIYLLIIAGKFEPKHENGPTAFYQRFACLVK